MSVNPCLQIEEETRPPNSRNRCERLDASCPNCLCEQHSFGNGSPGPVGDDEAIARFHFTGNDFLDNGSLSPAAFNDIQTHGLSVTRDQADNQQMERAISDILANKPPPDNWKSVSTASVRAIRALLGNNADGVSRRAFCVYDTATENNCLHAEVCGTQHAIKKKAASRELRVKPRDLFVHNQKDRSQYRGGRLQPVKPGPS